jgi:hypothetical protein
MIPIIIRNFAKLEGELALDGDRDMMTFGIEGNERNRPTGIVISEGRGSHRLNSRRVLRVPPAKILASAIPGIDALSD